MIRNEKEYKRAVTRLQEELFRLKEHEARLRREGIDGEGIKRVLDPIRSFHLQLQEEVDAYKKLKKGDLGEVYNLHGFGRMLIGLRIARGMTQKELADLLGIHESQVSRDERNEYHGITIERATRILDSLEVEMQSAFGSPVLPFKEPL